MQSLPRTLPLVLALLVAPLTGGRACAHAASAAPAFDVAYRAWDVVNGIARHNRDPGIGGECSKTFRPFVIPGLRRQTKQEEEIAAAACHEQARSVCADRRLQRTEEMARKCEEFK